MGSSNERPRALLETDYIPEKGRQYRETFQERHGRTWNEHINHYRERHPEYRERNRRYVAKARVIARLGLRQLLGAWELSHAEISAVLRRVPLERLNALVELLKHWDHVTGKAPRTALNLLDLLHTQHVHPAPSGETAEQSALGGNV